MKPTIPPEIPYADRALVADARAKAARLVEDRKKFGSFKRQTRGIEKHSVRAANLGRALGLSFAAYYLPPTRELAEAWFNAHYRKSLRMSFEVFNWFVAIARKLPEKSRCMADVMPALQLTLFAGELIALPERSEGQVSHATTPYTYFFNSLRGLQSDLSKRLSEASQWDAQTRSTIKEEIERAEKFLAEAKRQLT